MKNNIYPCLTIKGKIVEAAEYCSKGLSWQIIPRILRELLKDPMRAPRVLNALMQMKKLVIADLKQA